MTQKCAWCKDDIKPRKNRASGKVGVRSDRKTCSASCRTLLWMAQKVLAQNPKLAKKISG